MIKMIKYLVTNYIARVKRNSSINAGQREKRVGKQQILVQMGHVQLEIMHKYMSCIIIGVDKMRFINTHFDSQHIVILMYLLFRSWRAIFQFGFLYTHCWPGNI